MVVQLPVIVAELYTGAIQPHATTVTGSAGPAEGCVCVSESWPGPFELWPADGS